MKKYASNILIYIAALFGIVAFVCFFSSPLQYKDVIKGTWSAYNVKAYVGETVQGVTVYKGTSYPIIGFVVPLILSIFLIIESFKPSLSERLTIINSLFAVLFFISAVLVLLTKELFLSVNGLGEIQTIRNGLGPILSAICSFFAGIILLIVTWMPGQEPVDFIETN